MGDISNIDKIKDSQIISKRDANNIPNDLSISNIDNLVEDLFSEKENRNSKLNEIEIKSNEREKEIELQREKVSTMQLKLFRLSKEKTQKNDHIFETDFPGDNLGNEVKMNTDVINKNNDLNNIYKQEIRKDSEKPFIKIVEDLNKINNDFAEKVNFTKEKNIKNFEENEESNLNYIKEQNSIVKFSNRSISLVREFYFIFFNFF